MSSIEWVLFDLGGVVVEVSQAPIFEHLERVSNLSAQEIANRLMASSFFVRDLGVKECTPSQVTQQVNHILGLRLSEAEVIAALNAELGAEIATTSEMVPALQRRTKVGCLSNTNSIHWDRLLGAYPFMQRFDRRFASQILGHAKPGREIYEKVVEHLGVKPNEILFFDDKIENVESAQRLGWHARRYTSHGQLLADLREFKLA